MAPFYFQINIESDLIFCYNSKYEKVIEYNYVFSYPVRLNCLLSVSTKA